ncbi:PLP-dependent transferase [Polychaeton citri CBS 116435]|uniref:PLP-dependent transferase n=1 Tax=Polychaeton citri CBS 116435 TaxID=1314669 RepID=A0A9P4UJ14_9PEZI|nr:PLP-dependent transferase [Polychaeton citri CBS 116435]
MAASAECGVVDTEVGTRKDPIQLCMFTPKSTPVESFSKTAEYAKDQIGYLKSSLGQSTFERRQHLFCIPDEIERDFYGTGPTKQYFEGHIAKCLGKDHGLFFITGVQAQLAALKIYCQAANTPKVAWHLSSHLESAEEVAFQELYHLERIEIGNDPNILPSVDDIEKAITLPADQRPAAIVIEIPNRVLGCETYTFEELQRLSKTCARYGVKFHCDGARLWEIEPYYQETAGKSFADICGLFDSVYVSFYKGLGGVTGAMLVSNDAQFISDAKVWQRRAGGNAFQFTYEVVDCIRGYNESIGTFAGKRDKMVEVATSIVKATDKFKADDGQSVISFRPFPPTCCQVHTNFAGYTTRELEAARDKVMEMTGIRVFERLRRKQTLDDKLKEDRLAAKSKPYSADIEGKDQQAGLLNGTVTSVEDQDRLHSMEWMIMSVTEKLDTKLFVDGYAMLCEELEKSR